METSQFEFLDYGQTMMEFTTRVSLLPRLNPEDFEKHLQEKIGIADGF